MAPPMTVPGPNGWSADAGAGAGVLLVADRFEPGGLGGVGAVGLSALRPTGPRTALALTDDIGTQPARERLLRTLGEAGFHITKVETSVGHLTCLTVLATVRSG